MGCTTANVGQLVKRLRALGQVEKHVDRRLSLTLSGSHVFASCEAQLTTDAEHVLRPLDAQERELLLGMLRKLMTAGL